MRDRIICKGQGWWTDQDPSRGCSTCREAIMSLKKEGESMKPVIGILLGDATGIGPEIVAKMFAKDDMGSYCRPLMIGDRRILDQGKQIADVDFPTTEVEEPAQAGWGGPIPFIHKQTIDPSAIPMGRISAEAGRETGEMMVFAMELCVAGKLDGFVFGPYHKAAMEYGGYPLLEKGTGFFARHLNWNKPFGEMNVVKNLWTSRVTSHIPIKQVSENLSMRRIKGSIHLANTTLKKAGFNNPRIAVAALNPHCGEEGLCGREEIEVIGPAVREAALEGINVTGPFSADTLFVDAVNGAFDGVVTMYHDQGQIALKLLNFETAVTVLAGLPHAVTTPAHGTAFDIAGKGIANAEAMEQAVIIAAKIAGWRDGK